MSLSTTRFACLLLAVTAAATQASAALVHQWTFNGNANDSVGTAHGTLFNGATVTGNQLVLDGVDDYFASSAFSSGLGAKTLISWASLNVAEPFGPSSSAGSIMNVQTPDGTTFDGITFAKRQTNQWMAGSDGFNRTVADNGGAPDTTRNSPVMMAISYAADGSISLYRNGMAYGNPAQNGGAPLQSYTAGNVISQIGHRHGLTGILGGTIDEARVYDTNLNSGEIAAIFAAGPSAAAAPVVVGLLHRWSFSGNTNDSIGTAHGVLSNGASVVGGRLSLDGIDDQMLTSPINETITTKTLVSWVSLNDLNQPGGGSALSLQVGGGNGSAGFDGIVYQERVAGQWMAGSNGFSRTVANNGGAAETVANPDEVMMAIVYGSDNSIQIYRNGALYATAANTSQGTLNTYLANTADVIFGRRHDGAGNPLNGFIDEARIYGVALSPEQIQYLYQIGPNAVPEPSSLALCGAGLVGLAWYGRRRRRG